MTQVSRRYQIAFAVIALFAAVWFFALRGHSATSSGSSSPPPATSAKSAAAPPGAPTSVYHGSAPGVEGLTRAISKAHAAVAQSEHNAKQLKRASEEASSSAAGHQGASSTAPAAAGATGSHAAASASGSGTHGQSTTPHAARAGAATISRHQRLVERAIKSGKVAVILFWNPHGGDDRAVQGQLRLLARVHGEVRSHVRSADLARIGRVTGLELGKPIEVFQARAGQVAWFGTFTRAVQIYATPTILLVNHAGKVTTLPGLNDAYSIEQAIDEARNS